MKIKKDVQENLGKKLSKKQRKKLEKVLERRKKKKDVSELLDELKKHQLSDEHYALMTPKFGSQKKGFKRSLEVSQSKAESATKVYSSGKKYKADDSAIFVSTPYTLNFDESSSEEEEEEGEGDDDDDKKEEEEKTSSEKIKSDLKDEIIEKQTESSVSQSIVNSKEKSSHNLNSKSSESNSNLKTIASKFVQVNRTKEVISARNKLPIITEEYQIMEEIKSNPVVIVCGETGSGKTTQIPQFLYEHGFAEQKQIVVTQPRRVAAISMSKRVAQEMNLSEDYVSYQIRYEGNTTEKTKIKFVTDGVLMKEMQKDFLLSRYSIVIIDEAHERSIYSDILIGLISRVIKLREKRNDPLRLIIMSATLRITDFTENKRLFKEPPPVIKIESRQYPVSVHFSKYTPHDHIKEAYKKVCKIHKEYPEGAILVFVTGKKEVNLLISKLKRAFPQKVIQQQEQPNDEPNSTSTLNAKNHSNQSNNDELELEDEFLESSKCKFGLLKKKSADKKKKRVEKQSNDKKLKDLMPTIDLDRIGQSHAKGADDFDSDSDYVASDDDDDDDEKDAEERADDKLFKEPLYCLPLYSMLPEREQAKVFQPPPPGTRLCVVATNVAETALTIPNTKYVIDTGKIKNKFFDKYTGISAHVIEWCAKSSADQRAGRSGRTAPGHCFRLYSSAVYNHDFKEFPEAEILKKPLDDLILQMKSMHIEKINNFPFPTPPDLTNVTATEKRLLTMGALEQRLNATATTSSGGNNSTLIISSLGKLIINFPVSPRYGKMLAIALQQGLVDHMITIVACLTVQELFLYYVPEEKPVSATNEEEQQVIEPAEPSQMEQKWKEINAMRRKWLGSSNSLYLGDVMLMLKAVQACEQNHNQATFCEQMGIRHKSMVEIHKLRKQLIKEIDANFSGYEVNLDLQNVQSPTDQECKKLRQLMLIGFCDRVARLLPPNEIPTSEDGKRYKHAYKSIELESPVYLNEKCMLKEQRPEWVVYQEIYEHKKLYMRTVVAIEEEWIAVYAPNMCKFSKPMENPSPRYDSAADQVKCHVVPTFGPFSWLLKKTEIEYPECNTKYKLFAQSLLEGRVFTDLGNYTSDYISPPAILSKDWSRMHDHVNQLLSALIAKRITTKKDLKQEFDRKPSYLLKEVQTWLPQSIHFNLSQNWPPKN